MNSIISRKFAKQNSLKFYFTGKPCKYGHVDERYTSSSDCKTCRLTKSNERYREKRSEIREKQNVYFKNKYANDPRYREHEKKRLSVSVS